MEVPYNLFRCFDIIHQKIQLNSTVSDVSCPPGLFDGRHIFTVRPALRTVISFSQTFSLVSLTGAKNKKGCRTFNFREPLPKSSKSTVLRSDCRLR